MVDDENTLVIDDDEFAIATEEIQDDNDNEHEGEEEEEEDEEEDEEAYDSSDDEQVDRSVMADMNKLEEDFPSFAKKYRLIKRIGEGGLGSHPQRFLAMANQFAQGPSRPFTRPRTSSTTSTIMTGKTRLRRPNGHLHLSVDIRIPLVARTAMSPSRRST